MNILLIGHSVEDHIFYKGNESVKPGGMFYTASGMINIKDSNDQVFLITSIDETGYSIFEPVYKMTNTEFSLRGKNIIPLVRLDIYDDRERDEKYSRLGGRLEIPYSKLKDMNGILVNMITGFDITVEQLLDIKKSCNCPIYLDVHTLSRGVDEELRRPQRLIPDFALWSVNVDIIQVNDNEVFSLFDTKSERDIARRVLDTGTKYLIVTRGEKGSSIYYLRNGEMESIFISALKVDVKNKVGCGDIFGAVFFHSFLKFNNVFYALQLANTAAGMLSSYENADEMVKLKDDVFKRHN